MANVRRGEEFLTGFLGSIAGQQEQNMKNSQVSPELQAALLKMQSEGTIKPRQFANDPKGAMDLIAGMMGKQPGIMEQFQAVGPEQIGPELTNAFLTKLSSSANTDPGVLEAAKTYLAKKPLKTLNDAQVAENIFGGKSRASFFIEKGVDKATMQPLQMDTANGKYYLGGKEISAAEAGRTLSRNYQTVPSEAFDQAANYNQLVFDLNEVYKSFDPSNIGLFKRPLADIRRYLPDTPENITRFRAGIEDIKRKLATAEGGKQLTPFEYQTLVKTLPDDLRSVADFTTAINRYDNQLSIILKKRQSLSTKLYGMDVYSVMGGSDQYLPRSYNDIKELTKPRTELPPAMKEAMGNNPAKIKSASDYLNKFNSK